MLTEEEKASAIRIADFLFKTNYDKELMRHLFIELGSRTGEHRYDVLEFLKNTEGTPERLFLEICTYLQAPKSEAITFRVA